MADDARSMGNDCSRMMPVVKETGNGCSRTPYGVDSEGPECDTMTDKFYSMATGVGSKIIGDRSKAIGASSTPNFQIQRSWMQNQWMLDDVQPRILLFNSGWCMFNG